MPILNFAYIWQILKFWRLKRRNSKRYKKQKSAVYYSKQPELTFNQTFGFGRFTRTQNLKSSPMTQLDPKLLSLKYTGQTQNIHFSLPDMSLRHNLQHDPKQIEMKLRSYSPPPPVVCNTTKISKFLSAAKYMLIILLAFNCCWVPWFCLYFGDIVYHKLGIHNVRNYRISPFHRNF